jgi:hypothetical protein
MHFHQPSMDLPQQAAWVVKYGIFVRDQPGLRDQHGLDPDEGAEMSEIGMWTEVGACYLSNSVLHDQYGRHIFPFLTYNGGKKPDLAGIQIRGSGRDHPEFIWRPERQRLDYTNPRGWSVTKGDDPDDRFLLVSCKQVGGRRVVKAHGWLFGHEIISKGKWEDRPTKRGKMRGAYSYFLGQGFGRDPRPILDEIRDRLRADPTAYPQNLPPGTEEVHPSYFFKNLHWSDRKSPEPAKCQTH